MEIKLQMLAIGLIICLLLGTLLYFCYKKFYEHRINRVLVDHTVVKTWTIQTVMKVYSAIGILVLFLISFQYPQTSSACELTTGFIDPVETDEQYIQKYLYDELIKEDGKDSYSLQQQRVNEHLSITYANNTKAYAYVVTIDLGERTLDHEIVSVQVDGAQSWYDTTTHKARKFYVLIVGELKDSCTQVEKTISITNFCKGKNTDPIDIQEKVMIDNGGIHR